MRARALVVLCLLAVVAAGCGTGGAGEEGSGRIVFWHAYGEGPETEALNERIIPAFQEQHPGITVQAVTFPYDQLRQRLVTSTAGGTLPCLFRSDIIWVPEFADVGILVPLDEQMEDFHEHADLVYDAALETNLWEGHYYGLPLSTNTRVMLYNPEVLEAGGLDAPPATMQEFQTLAEGLEGTDEFVFVDNDTAGWNLLPWIWSFGGAFTDPDLSRASGYLNSPESVAAVELLAGLYREGEIPDLIIGAGGRDPAEGLAQGFYATMLDGPWMYPVFEGQFPEFEVQSALMPAGDGGSVSVIGGESIVLTRSCRDPGAAMEFMRFMVGEFAQTELAEAGQMSVRTDLADSLVEIQDYYGIFVEQLETGARPRTPHPEWTRMENVMINQVQTAFQGRQTVQQALDTAAEQVDDILARSRQS